MFLTCFYKSYEHVHIWEEVKSHWHSLGRHDNVYLMSQWRSRSLCHGVCMRTHIHARARSHCLFLYFLNLSYCLKKKLTCFQNERTNTLSYFLLSSGYNIEISRASIFKRSTRWTNQFALRRPSSEWWDARYVSSFFLEYARTLSKWNAMLIISAGIAFLSQIVFYA